MTNAGRYAVPGSAAIETCAYVRADILRQSSDRPAIHSTLSAPDVSWTVFDTLRFADRLKNSGFESQQAEGLARALGDEFGNVVAHLVTKSHFDSEIGAVRSEIGTMSERVGALDYKVDALGERLDARIDALDYKVDALGARLDSKVDALDCKVDALGERLDAKFDALDCKVDSLGARLDSKVDALDYRVDSLDGKLGARIDSLGIQLKFVFAMLALLLALGLVDTVPRILG